jgi:hypothetical protein
MRLIADSGLWSTDPLVAPTPVVAVLEVSGAVLSWTVDDPSTGPQIVFTELPRADWLWRVVGESGHSAVASALDGRAPHATQTVEVSGVDVRTGSLDSLRRLAFGHWLRRWWPASPRDGIAALDTALVDAEIAVLTAATEDFFTDDTFDSNVADMLRPHTAALNALVAQGDPRVIDLVGRCEDLADDLGVAFDTSAGAARRDDYALAAGGDFNRQRPGAVAGGVDSVRWGGVPAGIFDAAEHTVDWRIEVDGKTVKAVVQVALSGGGSPNGIAVRLRSAEFGGAGSLGADGRGEFTVVDSAQRPIAEAAAWNHDWRSATVTVGTDVEESVQTRERVRQFVRSRLARPGDDAYLAEILAAESDY